MLQNKEAVIFDLDGTLVDSMMIWKDIDIAYLKKHHIELPDDLQDVIEGMSFDETAEYFKKRFSLKDSIEQIKKDWHDMTIYKYTHEIPLKKGVREFLEHCKKKHYQLGIASSNSIPLIQSVLKAHGIQEYFTVIKSACEVAHGKPAPDVYLKTAEELQIAPDKCLVFEDLVSGIQAGKAAGMSVCAVEDTYSVPQREEKKRIADYYINDYLQLLEVIGS